MTRFRPVSPFLFALLLAFMLPGPALGWGGAVHKLINRAATGDLPPAFNAFAQWADSLETLATAADDRKSSVPGEAIKHYIDIDDYPEFATGTLSHSYAALVAEYGKSRVDGNGTLPWAIQATYNDLVQAFIAHNWSAAVIKAADLGHYVGDLHQPLHVTTNFDGQETNQDGIHSRFESHMTGDHLAELVPQAGTAAAPGDPLERAFHWIDVQHGGVGLILQADLDAKTASGGSTRSTTYYDVLWQELGPDTQDWIRDASLRLAGLWYQAWLEAGSPALPGQVAVPQEPAFPVLALSQASPNPFHSSTSVQFRLNEPAPARLLVYDGEGRVVRDLYDGIAEGNVRVNWDGRDGTGRTVPSGVYFFRLRTPAGTAAGKALYLR